MTQRSLALGAIVLAAGSGSRFGGDPGSKLLADLDGRPLLAHALDAVRQYQPATTVVVLGSGAGRIEAATRWTGEMRVRNHAPERGLASSLQVGLEALMAMPDSLDGAFVVLGDQPRLRVDVMRALALAAARSRPADRVFVVPRYADDPGPRNPILLLRPAWSFVGDLNDDQGLATVIEARPDQVLDVPVEGMMPDVDRPADLARLHD